MVQILTAATLWGTAGTFAKYLFNSRIPAYDLAQIRLTLSFVILLLVLACFNRKLLRVQPRDLRYLAVFGIAGLGMVQFTYLFTISLTNVATAVFLQYLAPALVLLFGLFTRTERLSFLKFLALLAAVIGGYLIVRGTAAGFGLHPLGLASGLASAAAFAFYTIYGKHGLASHNSWTILAWGMAFGSAAWFLYQPPWALVPRYSPETWLAFAIFASVATVLPFGLYFQGLTRLTAFRTGLTSTIEPVVAAVTAFSFLGERLALLQVLGCTLVLLGVILIQLSAQVAPDQPLDPVKGQPHQPRTGMHDHPRSDFAKE